MQQYAQNYDKTFAFFKNYSKEASFIKQILDRHRPSARSVLDIACGTGTHIMEIAKMGYRCGALDIDHDILLEAQRKAQQNGIQVQLFQQDMRRFTLPVGFDAAINMFYSFQNALHTTIEQQMCLQSIHHALTAGGLFIIELLPEENNLYHYPPGQTFLLRQEQQQDGTTLIVTSTNRILNETLKEVIFTYEIKQRNRTIKSDTFVSPIKRMCIYEIRNLLTASGFDIIDQYGDYDIQSAFTPESRKILIIARKRMAYA